MLKLSLAMLRIENSATGTSTGPSRTQRSRPPCMNSRDRPAVAIRVTASHQVEA